ncbi:DUF3883 domain-containing protein [Dinoroseobacter sp. S375]|uniref:DUF3883 domain-containing protein n=1 Tax=Dinoroseobacter sp. S375 TaxID=3415136 RepID=UPI003C797A67
MTNGPWTDGENDLIVADYFAMLAEDIAGHPYNKAAHRRALLPRLNDRSEGSVEFKHQNISAVLKGLGEDWIPGYKPAFNFQMTLVDAVARWLAAHPVWLNPTRNGAVAGGLQEAAPLWVGPAPTVSNHPPPQELEQMLQIARKFDVAARDDRNRALGEAGEARVLAHEQSTLRSAGREDLARKVRWVSKEDGDGAGYDIASFAPDGRSRLIEVKTTNGWERTPFHLSRNELAVAEKRCREWCLFRVWNFARAPKAFELRPPLEAHVSLTAMSFQARVH